MHASPTLAALAAALAAAQAEITNPHRNREVTVQPREGRPYSFSYATLDSILDGLRPILAKHTLSIIQTLERDGERLAMRTMLLHASGEWIATDVPLTVERTGNQAMGSAITYARRYGLTSLLAIAADEDDDANEADGNEVKGATQRPAPARPAPAPAQARPASPPQPASGSRTSAEEAAAAKLEFDHLTTALTEKMGKDEAAHQISALRKANADWRKQLVAIRALNDSTPNRKA
jgi:hypothetical protein